MTPTLLVQSCRPTNHARTASISAKERPCRARASCMIEITHATRPRPWKRSGATDLVSGRAKVFRSGSLSLALRSTMSLPGIFTPVRTKDAIYADGGLLQNIPVEVAKEMGAD